MREEKEEGGGGERRLREAMRWWQSGGSGGWCRGEVEWGRETSGSHDYTCDGEL